MLARLHIAALALFAAMAAGGAQAQLLTDQDWLLDPKASHIYLQTTKGNAITETHEFTGIEGTVTKAGDASLKIDLNTLETNIDIRNVRMRFLLWETFKFPSMLITAKLDRAKLQEMLTKNRIGYDLKVTVDLHGVVKEIEAPVSITRISDRTVSVATTKPIVVNADTFGLTAGVTKLSEAINGTLIVPAASITFDLMFATGEFRREIEAARTATARQRAIEAVAVISPEECENRLSTISRTGAIYFKTASAELDKESDPLLTSLADIASRCQKVSIEVTGHTDSVGTKAFNQRLSEQRARAVVEFLTRHGVNAARIQSAGFGDTRPVAANDSDQNRAKNRRIEFSVKNP